MYIIMYIQGKEYNPMKKWNNFEELKQAVEMKLDVPDDNEIVVEAYIGDNLVNRGNTFKDTYENIRLVCEI